MDKRRDGATNSEEILKAVRAYLDEQYVTSNPAADILDGLDKMLKEALVVSEKERALDAIQVPRNVAEHLYGSSQEVGGACHICKEFRAIVDEKWPSDRSLPVEPK